MDHPAIDSTTLEILTQTYDIPRLPAMNILLKIGNHVKEVTHFCTYIFFFLGGGGFFLKKKFFLLFKI